MRHCVVTCWKRFEYSRITILALLACDPAMYVVAVDNGSPDETGVWLDRMAAAMPERITVVHAGDNLGLWGGHNAGRECVSQYMSQHVTPDDLVGFSTNDCMHGPGCVAALDAAVRAGVKRIIGTPAAKSQPPGFTPWKCEVITDLSVAEQWEQRWRRWWGPASAWALWSTWSEIGPWPGPDAQRMGTLGLAQGYDVGYMGGLDFEIIGDEPHPLAALKLGPHADYWTKIKALGASNPARLSQGDAK